MDMVYNHVARTDETRNAYWSFVANPLRIPRNPDRSITLRCMVEK